MAKADKRPDKSKADKSKAGKSKSGASKSGGSRPDGRSTSSARERREAASASSGTSVWSAVALAIVAVAGFVYTLAVGNEPLLGLDLQGGVSVVYQPAEGAEFDEEDLDQTVEIIRNRVDGLGVAEPEISRQGDTIVVDLPGVEQQQRALQLVGETAELRFRPVILDPLAFAGVGAGIEPVESDGDFDPELDPDALDSGDADSSDADSEGSDEGSLAPLRGKQDTSEDDTNEDEDPVVEDDPVAEEDSVAEDEPVTEDDAVEEDPVVAPQLSIEELVEEGCTNGVTPAEADDADAFVLLEGREGGMYCLGPSLLTGDALETADVSFDGITWAVNPVFRDGPEGIGAFNTVAAICADPLSGNNGAVCPATGTDSRTGLPRGALAIVLDHEVVSAPLINAGSFDRNNIVISGTFDEESARDLALALRFGALPVELEAQQTRTVSASIGDDVLRSGLIAGIVGLSLVAIYVLFYYRLAGLVAIGGLVISGLLLWTVISWLGDRYGLAISLAGIVGLIVSIGVSTDSNIVYFENVKDIASKGRRVTTAVERAYQSAISTIVKADVVSLIAAGLLYFLTVGAVKGFALYLGIATLLDLLVSYAFMRPALAWIAARPQVQANPRLVGMPEGGASS